MALPAPQMSDAAAVRGVRWPAMDPSTIPATTETAMATSIVTTALISGGHLPNRVGISDIKTDSLHAWAFSRLRVSSPLSPPRAHFCLQPALEHDTVTRSYMFLGFRRAMAAIAGPT